ncbi:MAG: two-component regulator propeller domain-containing protein [Verrucomicrobiota bacterium]|jgi:signal transduction histidine kinase/ligand-binding sensor domain-containing protein
MHTLSPVPRRFKFSTCAHRQTGISTGAGIFWVLLCGFQLLGDTNSSVSDYSIDVWQTEQGLPQDSVTSVMQAPEGYLWLGTYNGLVRFDGVRFKVFDTRNTPEFGDSRITSLLEDADGTLWIGHETGDLTQLRAGKFTAVNLGNGWPGGTIWAMGTDADGVLWLLNKEGALLSMAGEKLVIPNAGSGGSVPSFAKDKNGELWVVRGSLLGTLRKGRLVPWVPGVQPDTSDVQMACASRDGGLWLMGSARVKKLIGQGTVVDLGPTPWGRLDSVTALLETKTGDLLAGTLHEGLFLLSPDGTNLHFTRQNGLSHDWVLGLCEDRERNLWVGTGGGGLDVLRRRKVEMVKASDDWQGRAILSVTPAVEGGLWVGTEGAGLYRLDKGEAKPFTETNGLLNSFTWAVLEDHLGDLWVGTFGGGLFVRHDGQFQFPKGLEDPAAVVFALYQDRQGVMWVGTQSGLAHYANGQCTWFTRKDGLVLPSVRVITEDATGAIWFGMSGGGLGRLKDGKLTQFRRPDGLANDFVWSLLAEKDGTLWVGTFGGGLCRLRAGRFATISTREGLPNNVICHIADDGQGNFWISSYGGIFRVSKEELNRCADGQLKVVNCLVYGKAEGLSTLECSGGFQSAGCQTPDGQLWFSTIKGLAVVNPAGVKINPFSPPVLIEEVIVDDQLVPLPASDLSAAAARLQIQPGKRRFEFRYTGLSLVAPEKVRFKYRLDGLESDWMDVGTRRVAYYSYLKPGDYTFRVIACNNDGVWSESGPTLAFTVLPWFWQTWWFTGGAVLAGVGVVGGAARYITRRRLHKKMERLERQRVLENERSRIAKDIHDDLGSNLARIMMLSQSNRAEGEDPQQIVTRLGKVYLTARELTRTMDEIVWAVSPHHDTLDSLVNYLGKFAQDFLNVAGIRCRLVVPIQLPAWPLTAEVRHSLFLAFKEALHNVVKHASATEVRVSLTLAESGFSASIEDNGIGFDPAGVGVAATTKDPLRIAGGNGLANMRKRIGGIGGECQVDSAPGKGTTVRFIVRVEN